MKEDVTGTNVHNVCWPFHLLLFGPDRETRYLLCVSSVRFHRKRPWWWVSTSAVAVVPQYWVCFYSFLWVLFISAQTQILSRVYLSSCQFPSRSYPARHLVVSGVLGLQQEYHRRSRHGRNSTRLCKTYDCLDLSVAAACSCGWRFEGQLNCRWWR